MVIHGVDDRLARWSGLALATGGVLMAVSGLVFTPFMPAGQPLSRTAVSAIFLWRESTSAAVAGLVLFGTIGLYVRQADAIGLPGAWAFLLAFVGSAMLVAWEWVNVFVLRPLALATPAAADALDAGGGLGLYTLGALVPLLVFSVGWLFLAGMTLRLRRFSRAAASLVLAGFLFTPVLTPVLGLWGAGLANALLGVGWCWIGLEVTRGARVSPGGVPAAARSSNG